MNLFGSEFFWFALRLLLSFFLGGLYIALIIRISEKYGSKSGGVIAGMPSTVLISLAFIAWTQGPDALRAAIVVIPAGLGMSCLFLTLLVYSHRYNKILTRVLAFFAWAMVMVLFVRVHIKSLPGSVALAVLSLVVCLRALSCCPDRTLPCFKLKKGDLLLRTVFSGLVIALSVLCSKLLGPTWGGLVASFPAASFCAAVLLTRRHGLDFSAAVVKKVPYGAFSNVCFLVTLFCLVPLTGVIWALLVAYGISFTVAAIALSFA